jgi:hypothetical protein
VVFWACLIAALYLPTLALRFDFSEDGNLIYPWAPASLSQGLERFWGVVLADYRGRGPFQPVVRAHLQVQAQLWGPAAFRWHLARVVWSALATATLLWLLLELGIRPRAALATAAMAIWSPYRSSVWINLALAEGAAMPYAMLGLACALRATRSRRPSAWDVAGALAVLAAVGCKNTLAAIVPAQVLLRLGVDEHPLREGWRHHGRRACLLALTLLAPMTHYILFRLNWHPGQYVTGMPSAARLGGMLGAVGSAANLYFVGPGLALATLAILWNPRPPTASRSVGAELRRLWPRYRAACLAGSALLVFGIAVYLPVALREVYPRYSMPAVWGADLWVAATLSALLSATAGAWKRAAAVALGCGLGAMAIANLAIQDRFAAHNSMLWQALEFIERRAPPNATVGWMASPELPLEEGIHFFWHLQARGRKDLAIRLYDPQGRPQPRPEGSPTDIPPGLVVGTASVVPPGGPWREVREFAARFWGGTRRSRSYVWVKAEPLAGAPAEEAGRPPARPR